MLPVHSRGQALHKQLQKLQAEGLSIPNIQNVKPASNLADYKSVAAMIALRQAAPGGFQNITSLWVGQLLQQGLLFHEKLTDTYILSLGFQSYVALGWEVKPLPEDPDYFELTMPETDDACHVRLQFFSTVSLAGPPSDSAMNDEEFAGVPFEICYSVLDVFKQRFQLAFLVLTFLFRD